jgi:hypothetical protein
MCTTPKNESVGACQFGSLHFSARGSKERFRVKLREPLNGISVAARGRARQPFARLSDIAPVADKVS